MCLHELPLIKDWIWYKHERQTAFPRTNCKDVRKNGGIVVLCTGTKKVRHATNKTILHNPKASLKLVSSIRSIPHKLDRNRKHVMRQCYPRYKPNSITWRKKPENMFRNRKVDATNSHYYVCLFTMKDSVWIAGEVTILHPSVA